jgi:hypothetical protein
MDSTMAGVPPSSLLSMSYSRERPDTYIKISLSPIPVMHVSTYVENFSEFVATLDKASFIYNLSVYILQCQHFKGPFFKSSMPLGINFSPWG